MPIQGKHRKLYAVHKFHVKDAQNGLGDAKFNKASGLSIESPVIEYREGGALAARKMPGLVNFSSIELSRGVSDVDYMGLWFTEVVNMLKYQGGGGAPPPDMFRDLLIQQLDRDNTIKWVWHVRDAFPSNMSAPDYDNDSNEVAIESLTIDYYFFTREAA
jgi:phage tail-like protein